MNRKLSSEKMRIREYLKLDCGDILNDYEIAFKTFGKLNKKNPTLFLFVML